MKIFRSPIFFIFFTAGLSKGLAIPLAAVQWIGIRIKFNFPPAPITQNPYGLFYSLKMKWFTWVMQKYISLRLRLNPRAKSILKLVDQEFEVPVKGGCIIATLHSPWAKLLCAWSKENNFAMVVAADKWSLRAGSPDILGSPIKGLRKLIRHLKGNGKVVIVADVFCFAKRACSVNFLEKRRMVSLLPARLSKCAGVPIILAIPKIDAAGKIRLAYGPRFEFNQDLDTSLKMRYILRYFENRIRREPHVWLDHI